MGAGENLVFANFFFFFNFVDYAYPICVDDVYVGPT